MGFSSRTIKKNAKSNCFWESPRSPLFRGYSGAIRLYFTIKCRTCDWISYFSWSYHENKQRWIFYHWPFFGYLVQKKLFNLIFWWPQRAKPQIPFGNGCQYWVSYRKFIHRYSLRLIYSDSEFRNIWHSRCWQNWNTLCMIYLSEESGLTLGHLALSGAGMWTAVFPIYWQVVSG